MCGIAGIVNINGGRINHRHLNTMADTIAHRGGDDEGFALIETRTGRQVHARGKITVPELKAALPSLEEAGDRLVADIGFAHRRFSIIDLSSAGHQPFFDEGDGITLVFNGEIYNYVELRFALEREGVRFRTKSDTEVLLKAYRHWGEKCFERFNGFWALALYDFRKRRLLLSRDRLGKKPLFWTRIGDQIIFASEIKALLVHPEVDRVRDVETSVIYPWLRHTVKDADERTFFRGIFKLPAACYAFVDDKFPENASQYWALPQRRSSEQDVSPQNAAEELRELLTQSVQLRLRADVPVGCELSGGIDSSCLLALAASVSSVPIKAYTVKVQQQGYDEEPYARIMAERFASDYKVLTINSGVDFWNGIESFTSLEEEPYHSPNLQTNQRIWESMRADGTKISLNGLASDEIFAGYSYYYLPGMIEAIRHGKLKAAIRNFVDYSESEGPSHTAMSLARQFITLAGPQLPGIDQLWARLGLSLDSSVSVTRDSRAWCLSERLYEDFKSTRIPYWLTSGDRSYMGVPLEVRAPFLDHRVVEFGFKLPIGYMIRDGWHKWILRKSLEPILPESILWRRKKLGYPFPMERFLHESEPILRLIGKQSDNPYIRIKNGQPPKHWPTLSFILWYELFIRKNTKLFENISEVSRSLGTQASAGYTARYRD